MFWLKGRRRKGGMNINQGFAKNLGTCYDFHVAGADEAVVVMKDMKISGAKGGTLFLIWKVRQLKGKK